VVVTVANLPLHQLPLTQAVISPLTSNVRIVGMGVGEAIIIILLALFAKFVLSLAILL
jgi:hypothetical protein